MWVCLPRVEVSYIDAAWYGCTNEGSGIICPAAFVADMQALGELGNNKSWHFPCGLEQWHQFVVGWEATLIEDLVA